MPLSVSSLKFYGFGLWLSVRILGLLHMEIIQERIRREYDVEIISTYPSVIYRVEKASGETIEVDNPINLPDPSAIERILEPTIKATIHVPNDCIGDILNLVMDKREFATIPRRSITLAS